MQTGTGASCTLPGSHAPVKPLAATTLSTGPSASPATQPGIHGTEICVIIFASIELVQLLVFLQLLSPWFRTTASHPPLLDDARQWWY